MDQVVEDEAEGVDREELVHPLEHPLLLVEDRVEAERHVALLERPVDLHVGVVVDRPVARRGDHEADHARLVGELLDEAQRTPRAR